MLSASFKLCLVY